eukprot:CAMPEP_0203966966 /NCGR_PEP_ID=MMETSP0359-20131031/96068_1 /ASSEMBLY_ACC=CAM_ASM_000338 /TAXON_ID=268821 /ORGANISM="Scrippsiella Hangoei, Strain SHTV-5" /LENGTH=47 /DNA_ID= /DNA_START= /DNA_END= /DNA_ORIENTATION=
MARSSALAMVCALAAACCVAMWCSQAFLPSAPRALRADAALLAASGV